MKTADIIKKARMEAELTQQQLAGHYKIPLRTLVDWERGTRTPPEYVLEFLLRCLKRTSPKQKNPQSAKKFYLHRKKLIFTDPIGKPLKSLFYRQSSVLMLMAKYKNLGSDTFDEEDNCRQDLRENFTWS